MRHAYQQGSENSDDEQEDFKVQIILMGRSSFTNHQWEVRERSEKPSCDQKGCSG